MKENFTLLKLCLWLLLFCPIAELNAQVTVQIGSGTDAPASTLYSPVYRFSAGSTTNGARSNIVFTQAEMAAAGIPSGAIITSVQFHKRSTGSFLIPATYKMYMANTSNTSLATTLTWASVMSTHTEVYNSTSFNVPSTIGWVTWNVTPFNYTGGSLEIAQEHAMTGGTSGADNFFSWEYTAGNTDKIVGVASATGATLNGTVSTYKQRPNIKISYILPTACSGMPDPGVVTSSVSFACSGAQFDLLTSGSTAASGISYQWQVSPDSLNWTNISGSNNPAYTTTQTATRYYRVRVSCGSDTGNSNVVKVETPAAVSGTFTINGTQPTAGTNFNSFTDAINYIKCGINGPVVLNVEPGTGPYLENISIPEIGGASATNTITINGNGNTLEWSAPDGNNRVAINLNGADHIIIDSLVIDMLQGATTPTFGWGILFTNGADSNIVRKCQIITSTSSTTSANFIPVAFNGSATATATSSNAGNYNVVTNNILTGGYYGVYLYGNSTSSVQNIGNEIRNNIITDPYSYGIYAIYQSLGLVISGNDISRPTRTNSTTTAGAYVTTNTRGALIEKNRVHNMFDAFTTSTSTAYGIYISGDGTTSTPTRIINNVIYNLGGNGAIYGIYNSSADTMVAYHNTIALDDQMATTGAAYGFYQTGAAQDIIFRNNIVYVTRSGTGAKRALYFLTTTSGITSNNNVLFMAATSGTNNHLGQYGSTNYTTLGDWKSANGGSYDQTSVSVDPLFSNPSVGDFLLNEPAVNGVGGNVGVTHDILNNPRSLTAPDPGAYEFTLTGTDADISWVAPTMPVTSGNKTITVNITNTQTATITTLNLSYTDEVNIVTENFTGLNIAPGQSQQLSFTQQYNLTGNVRLRAYINLVNGAMDNSQANDSTAVQRFCLPMSGTYTINNGMATGGNNFASFSEAVSQLACSGVSGPVTLDVDPFSGPYTENFTIEEIPGTSETNRVTIKGNGVALNFTAPDATNRTAVVFNGADYVTLDSLMIDLTQTTASVPTLVAGWGVAFINAADHNILRNCTIKTLDNSTSTNYMGIIFNGSLTGTASSSNAGNYNKVINNTVNGGYYSVYLYGNSASTTQNIGNEVIGNTLRDMYSYAIYAIYQSDSLVISKNDVSRPLRTNSTTTAGVFLTTNTVGALVEKNSIHNMFDALTTSTSTVYGIYVGADATAAKPNRIENNLVYNLNTNGTAYGIYNTGGDNMTAYHNTISLDETTPTTGAGYGIYQTTAATGIDIKNNIVNITRSGTGTKRALYFVTTTSGISSNNNTLYMMAATGTNNHLGQWGTTNYTTLADWKTANSAAFDQASISEDPLFFNATGGEYEPTNSLLDNKGVYVGVTTDIRDSLRSGTTPDPGAYEFSTLTAGKNMSAVALISPTASSTNCYGNSEPVTVRIRNASTSTINFATDPVTVTVNVTGATTQTLVATLTSGTLLPDSTMDVVMPANVDMTTAGTYTFNAYTTVSGDANSANDAITPVDLTRDVLETGTAAVSPTDFCVSSVSNPVLSTSGLSGYSSLQWQESSSATSGFVDIAGGTTSPYTLSSAPTQAMYYRLIATCGGQLDTSNVASLGFNNPQITSTTPDTTCGPGSVTLEATAAGTGTVNWYETATGGSPVYSGNSFTTSVSATTTFYASANAGGASYSTGMTTPSGATPGSGTTNFGLVFDVLSPFLLESVTIYPVNASSNPGTVKIDVIDGTGAIIHTATFSNVPSSPGGTIPYVATLNFNMAPGTNLKMRPGSMTGFTQLAFQPSAAAPAGGYAYPYAVPGVVSINTSTLTAAPTNTARNDLYYYFYDWQISTGCSSPRVAVEAYVDNTPGCATMPVTGLIFAGERKDGINRLSWSTVTEINNAGFELQASTDGISFNKVAFVATKAEGGNSTTSLSYQYDHKTTEAVMHYRLKQIDKDGKTSYSTVVTVKASATDRMQITRLYPNPASDRINLQMISPAAGKVQLITTDITGRIVSSQQVTVAAGDNQVQLNITSLSQGTYFIKAICADGCESVMKKFVKQN